MLILQWHADMEDTNRYLGGGMQAPHTSLESEGHQSLWWLRSPWRAGEGT